MYKTVRIFTDGSAVGNPGPGGWGAVLIQGRKQWEISGALPWTTIEAMELLAAISALRSLPAGSVVELRSDSEYLVLGMKVFVSRWRREAWRNSRGTELHHRELWTELVRLNSTCFVRWIWMRGHNGHPIQCRADALAYRAAKTLWFEKHVAA